MFRRHWSGLPKDPIFPDNLKGLGYFVNDEDEIRSIDEPDRYFKYMLDHNDRVNTRQSFHFNLSLEGIIHKRLEDECLEKTLLPLGATSETKHIPIFTSHRLGTKSRVVIIFGEPVQPLGMLAARVANGRGGIAKGSIIKMVQSIKEHVPDAGIIIANMGALYWWPEGKRSLTVSASHAVPMKSMAHYGVKFDPLVNCVSGHETTKAHMKTIFQEIVSKMVNCNALIQIIGLGTSSEEVVRFLEDTDNWNSWGRRVEAMVLTGNTCQVDQLQNAELKKLLEKRTRSYLLSPETLDTPVASPTGNPTLDIPANGSPCYSSSEDWCTELMAIKALPSIVAYLRQVSIDPEFENEAIVVVERPKTTGTDGEGPDSWDTVDDAHKPIVEAVDEEKLRNQRMWNRFEEKGSAVEESLVTGCDQNTTDDNL